MFRLLGILALCICGSLSCGSIEGGVIENMFSSWWKKPKAEPPMIKVLVVHDQPGVVLEVKGKYKLHDPHTQEYISTRFIGKRKFIQALNDGLKWGEEFPGVHQLEVVPDDSKTTTLVDGVEYKGNIYVYDIGGTISIVNEVPLEDYLRGLLVPQFERKVPVEVANAIAIAARTNALYFIQNAPSDYWSVEAEKVGYEGNAASAHNNGIVEAIKETRNMVMEKDGGLFPAVWGSSEGGSSSSEKPVFSRITLFDAENLAEKGDHAAQILGQAFPGSSITLIEKTTR